MCLYDASVGAQLTWDENFECTCELVGFSSFELVFLNFYIKAYCFNILSFCLTT